MHNGINLKQWYGTLVSSSLSVIAFGHDSEKLELKWYCDPCPASSGVHVQYYNKHIFHYTVAHVYHSHIG